MCLFLPKCKPILIKNDDIFVSGSLDKIIRIFSIKKKKIIDYINVVDLITAISFSPCSGFIVSGYHNGKCDVFSYEVMSIYKKRIS